MSHRQPRRPSRPFLLPFLVLLVGAAVVFAFFVSSAIGTWAVGSSFPFAATADPLDDDGITVPIGAGAAPKTGPAAEPGERDGVIASGAAVSIEDASLPAIANLDAALRDAVAQAARAAAEDGIELRVSSGWRSAAYQQWLFDDATRIYGSAEAAAEFVATAESSSHVTGDAVDIVPVDAQYWLIQYGSRWGLCQTYANEVWHFELASTPGGSCPQPWSDAAARG